LHRLAGVDLTQAAETRQRDVAILDDVRRPDSGEVRAKLASVNASPDPSG
jgi:hypothetical protein